MAPTMLSLSILLAVAGVLAAVWRGRAVPESISAAVYALPRGWQGLWTAWVWAVDFALAMPLMDALGTAAGILSQVCVAIVSPWWLAAWLAVPLAWLWTTKDCPHTVFDGKGVLLCEAICAVSVYGALLSTI